MIFDPNGLFYEMVRIYIENRGRPEKVTICNEGGTRSAKTWDFFHFLVFYCDHNRNKHNEIYILRETLVNCKDYTFKEFRKCLNKIGIWNDDNFLNPQKPYYNLFGNDIYFRGLDDSSEGYPSDILFINEALENQNRSKIDGLSMRCRKLIVKDWNPKYTHHWCFDLEGQPNVHFTHSTYKNNKHLEESNIKTIESYEPTPYNIKVGTADEYRWKVYGLGQRAAQEGVIYENVVYIDKWPDDIAHIYGLDFGFTTDPSALVKAGEDDNNFYIELLLYHPVESSIIMDNLFTETGLNKDDIIIADSSDKYTGENKGTVEMVIELMTKGWLIRKVSKTKSNMFWIGKMKEKKINIITNKLVHFARREHENYVFKTINGIAINQPIDKFNHMWDAAKYAKIGMTNTKLEFY